MKKSFKSPSSIIVSIVALVSLLAVSVSLLQYTRLSSSNEALFVFIGLPLISFIVCFFTLFLSDSIKSMVIVIYVSALGGLYLFEGWQGATKFNHAAESVIDKARAFGVTEIDERPKAKLVEDLRQQGQDIYSSAFPSLFLIPSGADGSVRSPLSGLRGELMPLGGIAKSRAVLCNEAGPWVIHNTDRHGFDNPDSVWDTKIQTVLLGDSFTQGMCVDEKRSFAGLLGDALPGVVNLGMGGNGPLFMLASLVEYARPLKPRDVVWFYFEGNDMNDLTVEKRSPLLMHYLDDKTQQNLIDRADEIRRALIAHIDSASSSGKATGEMSISWRLKAFRFLTLTETRIRFGLTAAQMTPPDYPLLDHVLDKANSLTTQWGGRLTLVYLPSWTSLMDGKRSPDWEKLNTIAKRLNLPVIDMQTVMAAQPDIKALFPLHGPGHYAEPGHRLVAETVKDALMANR